MAKRVTLTFDNGPSAEVTPFVLDELADRELSAWFCLVGTQLATPGARKLALSARTAGHRIVNHTMTHTEPLGDVPTRDYVVKEIVANEALLSDALGDFKQRWFRPIGRGGVLGPHVFSRAALRELSQRRYSVLLWNSVPRDWEYPDTWVEHALRDIAARDHTVVVLHDLPTGAMRELPRFLDELSRRDIYVTLDVPADCVPLRDGVVEWPVAELDRLVGD